MTCAASTACRFLRPLLPNRANEVFNKETTIRFHNACISVYLYTMQAMRKTRKHVQLRKWPSSPTRTDEIEARLHQTSCPLTRPGLQRLGQTHQESTSPPMAVDETQAWHPLDSSHSPQQPQLGHHTCLECQLPSALLPGIETLP